MMTQSSAVSPIGSHGTRRAGHGAKALRAVAPCACPVHAPSVPPLPRGAQRPGGRRVKQVMLLARFLVVAATATASLVPAAAHAEAGPRPAPPSAGGEDRPSLAPPPVGDDDRSGDRLTVTVRHAGRGTDGTYELSCHPGGGTHPDADAACAVLDRDTTWGKDVFAPVPD